MDKKRWKSNAEWPPGAIAGSTTNTSTDEHDTDEQAIAVCRMLREGGLGGEGKVFPIRTWVEAPDGGVSPVGFRNPKLDNEIRTSETPPLDAAEQHDTTYSRALDGEKMRAYYRSKGLEIPTMTSHSVVDKTLEAPKCVEHPVPRLGWWARRRLARKEAKRILAAAQKEAQEKDQLESSKNFVSARKAFQEVGVKFLPWVNYAKTTGVSSGHCIIEGHVYLLSVNQQGGVALEKA